jgi:hypothetical protein
MMGRACLVGYLLATCAWLGGCSRLFDADRAQCETAVDCMQLGGVGLSCVRGLCTQPDESHAQPADGGAAPTRDADTDELDSGPSGDGDASLPSHVGDAGHGDGDGDDDASTEPAECPNDPRVRFCDGFENQLEAWQTDVDEGTSLDVVSSPVAHAHGRHALEVRSLDGGERWTMVHARFPAVDEGPLWVRAFFFTSSDMTYDAVTTLRLEASTDNKQGIDMSLEDIQTHAVLYAEIGKSHAEKIDTQRFPIDAYVCVELGLVPDTLVDGTASLYVGGRLVGSVSTPLPVVPLDVVRAGMFYASRDQPPATLRVDTITVSTERLGCD